MNIRLVNDGDLETLIQVRLDFFREMFEPQSREEERAMAETIRRYYAEHLGRDFWAVLAEDNGRLAGAAFITLAVWPPNPDMLDGRVGEVCNVLTYPQYRGRGVATEMMRRLIDVAKDQGASRVTLCASEAGKHVYLKLGFVEHAGHTRMHLKLSRRKFEKSN